MRPSDEIMSRALVLTIDGDEIGTVALGDFLRENELDADIVAAISTLAVGETYEGGGGAAESWSVRRVS